MTVGATRGPTFGRVLAASVIAASFAALLVLPYPFRGDQSLFAVFARMITEGAELYRDIWDVKQPGIFWFYALAGSWNGFSPVWIHVVEAVGWIGGSVWVAIALRRHVEREWVAGFFPLLAPAIYFGVAQTNELTQVEPLISLLVVAVLLLMAGSRTSGWGRSFVAGLISGLIGIFKLAALVVPAAILACAFLLSRRRSESFSSFITGRGLPFLAGLAIPVLGVAIWVAASGMTELIWFTWFEYPPQVLEVNPRPLSRLLSSSIRFATALAPVGALAAFRIFNRRRLGRELTWLAVSALLACVVLVLAQLWWSYLFFVMVGPLAVVAIQGIDDLLEFRFRVVALSLLLILCVPPIYWVVEKAASASEIVVGGSLEEYRSDHSSYSSAVAELGSVDFDRDQPIYVLGDPSILYLSGLDQGIPINGWSPEFWTTEIWHQVADDLVRSRVSWLYVADWATDLASERAPWFEDQILSTYELHAETEAGRWLRPGS